MKAPLTFEEAIASACRILELEPTVQFQSKIIHFIQLLQANNLVGKFWWFPTTCVGMACVIVLPVLTYLQVLLAGAPGCGKTSCFTVASEAMRLLGYCVQTSRISFNRGTDDIGGHWDDR